MLTDKVLTRDGHTWLSYMTVSGARRYVDIACEVTNQVGQYVSLFDRLSLS
ncbi:MAG: SH3 domain-containing protein [Streptococcus salivarius]